MIEVEKITKRFGAVTAIDGVSFSIEKGEVVGFLGPNGAGKTTTMRVLTCYIPADQGEATVAGFDVLDDSMEVRKRIGYLPENAPLYSDMRVDTFLDYVASIRGLSGSDKTETFSRIIDSCGLAEALKKPIGTLSKGYRQRVGLAQAMVLREIRGLIKELGKEKTVILSTHILSEVEATCDRVIIINRGKIVADGSVDEISASAGQGPKYMALFRGDKEKIETGLKTIGDIEGFAELGKDDGGARYEITPREGARPGGEIFRMAADGGLTIAELTLEKPSLESAFFELTVGRLAASRAEEEEEDDYDDEEEGEDDDGDEATEE